MNKLHFSLRGSFLVIFLLLAGQFVFAQTSYYAVIGTDTADPSIAVGPVYRNHKAFRYQTVYTAAELNAAGLTAYDKLVGLGFSISVAPSLLKHYTIRIGHTASVNASNPITDELITVREAADYSPDQTSSGSFDMINFDSGAFFIWNGTNNIVIEICTHDNQATNPYSNVFKARSHSFSNASRFRIGNSSTSLCDLNISNTNDFRPQIRFRYYDGITPSCIAPTGLTASNYTYHSMDLSWTGGGGGTFDINWGEGSFVAGEGTTVAGFANGGTLSGLTMGTPYSYYVRRNCGAESSIWAGPYSFTIPIFGTDKLPVSSCNSFGDPASAGSDLNYNYNNHAYSQLIYTASEVGALLSPGSTYITKIGFKQIKLPDSGTENYRHWKIALVNTPKSSFSGPISANDWIYYSQFTEVFSGAVDNSTTGWIEIPLDVPFVWDEESNLAIAIYKMSSGGECDSNGGGARWESYNAESFRGQSCNSTSGTQQQQYPPAIHYRTSEIPTLLLEGTPVPDCFKPFGLTVTNITRHTADFTWEEGAENTQSFSWFIFADNADPETATPLFSGTTASPSKTVSGLTAETPYDFYVKANCGSGDGMSAFSLKKDFTTAIACPAPTDLTAYDATQNTVTLSWASQSSSLFDIEWGEGSFEQGSGTMISNHSGTTYPLTGLQPATTYSYYVRGNCGSPYGLSFWSGPYSFITAEMGQIGGGLSSTSLPGASEYNYNYSQQIYLASELNTVITSGTYISKIRFRHNWVPPMFIAYLSEAFMDWKIYMGSTSKTAFDSTTDWIPLSQLSQVFSGTIAFTADFEQQALWIEITLTNPFPWDGVSNLVVAIDENSPGSYTSGTFVSSFASFTAGSNRGIMYSGSSNANPASPPVATYGPSNNIAKIKLTTINCPVPTNLNAAYTSDDAIAFSWTSNSSLFDIEWGEGSFEQGSGTMVTAHSGTSYEITGVQPDTTYSYYVRGNCGAAGQSDWAGPYSFAPGYIGINSDTGQGNLPVYSTHNYNYSQMIYRADELSAVLAPGETYITKISFYQLVVPSSGTENYQQWEVSLANTTKTSFTSPTNWVGYSNFTQVFSGSVDNNTAGWVEIIFDIPFIWDGVSNLAISVREQSPGSSSSTAQWAAYDTGVVRGLRHSGSGGGHEAYAANDSTGNYSQQPKPANFSTTLMPQLLVEATTVPDCLPPDASLTGVTNHTASFIWEGQDNNLSYSWVIVADNADPETATPLFSGMVTASSVTVSDLPAETQYDFYVKADCGAEDGTSIYSMRVDFITATACATPTSLTAGSIAQNAATLSWTSEASFFDIEWGEAFFEQGNGTMINNHSGTTYLLNGLQPGIVYHYYVRSNCGGSDGFSLWAGPYSFETSEEDQIGGGAAVANFPVNSTYDYNYSQQIYFASDLTSALDSGPAYINKIRFKHNDVFPYYTGDDIGSSYANWRVYLGNTSKAVFSSNTDWVPLSQLTQVFSGTLTFEAYSWVEITLANPFVWDGESNLVVAIDENSPESIDPIYFQFQASFASFNAGTNRGIMTSGSTNINPASPPAATYGPSATISQIQLAKISCPVPINLNVNFTIDTATLSWTSNAPTFDIEWGEGSFEQGSGTMVTAHNGTTYTLPEFQPSVSYSYYVRGNCGSDGQSDWAGPFSFTTPLPGYIGFGSASSNGLPINSCLTRSYSQLIYRASELNAMLVPGEHYITKIGFKQTELPDTGTENYRKWRVAFANTTKASFSAFNNWLSSGNFTQVFLGNVDTGILGWVEITLDTPFLWDGVSNLAISISEETPDGNCNLGSTFGALWASYNGGGYRGMLGRGYSGNNAMAQQEGSSGNSMIQPGIFRSTNIPQLMVEMVGCPEPVNLNAVISVESATLSWTGGGSLFDIEWGEGSFEPGNGTMINGYTGSTYEISGLQPSTTYSYYVRRDCGENGTSDWAGP
ncbi:MAG: fibronectin type III domain-containing protein, partial [Flavobacteriaceae bacterium]